MSEPMAAARDSWYHLDLAGSGLVGGVLHRAALDFRDAGGNAYHHARLDEPAARNDLLDEILDHLFRHVRIRDDAVPQGADGDDIPGRFPEHAFGFGSDGDDALGAAFDGDDRRFVYDDALAPDVDERIAGTEVYSDVQGKRVEQFAARHDASSRYNPFRELLTGRGMHRIQGNGLAPLGARTDRIASFLPNQS